MIDLDSRVAAFIVLHALIISWLMRKGSGATLISMARTFATDVCEILCIVRTNLPIALASAADLYRSGKQVFTNAPLATVKYALCQVLSMLVPGTYGSKFFADHAQVLRYEIDVTRHGIETLQTEAKRLVAQFNAMATESFSKNDLKSLTKLIRDVSNEGLDRPKILKLERALAMPRTFVHLRPEDQGARLKEMLKASMYGDTIGKDIYEYVALTAVGIKHGVHIPRRTPYLCGPPGTGKTRLVQQMAAALGLPYVSVNIDKNNYLGTQMFGSGVDIGQIVDFVTNQPRAEGSPNAWPVVVHIDECDRILNSPDVSHLRDFFLKLLNSDDKTVYSCPFIGGMHLNVDNILFVLSGNELIRKVGKYSHWTKDSEKQEADALDKLLFVPDPAFQSRLNVVTFPGYAQEEKRAIAQGMIEVARLKFGPEFRIQDATLQAIQALVAADANAGVRELETEIYRLIVMDGTRQDGWEY